MAKYTFKSVKKAVVATVFALATGAGSVAVALADFPDLAAAVAAVGGLLTGFLTFVAKNEAVIDEGTAFGDNAFGLDK